MLSLKKADRAGNVHPAVEILERMSQTIEYKIMALSYWNTIPQGACSTPSLLGFRKAFRKT